MGLAKESRMWTWKRRGERSVKMAHTTRYDTGCAYSAYSAYSANSAYSGLQEID